MKKFILAIFIAIILTGVGHSQVALSAKDSLTSLQDTDLMLWQRYVTGTFLNRKMSYNYLKLTLKDYLDGQAITWAANQTFSTRATFSNGATFALGAYGTVTMNDSVVVPNLLRSKKYNPYDATSTMGSRTAPMAQVYSWQFIIPNTEGNDSVSFTYDDSTLTINKEVSFAQLLVTETVSIDSGATFDQLIFTPHDYSIPNTTDTILAIDGTHRYSFIRLDLPGNTTSPGISKLQVDEATVGLLVRLVVTDVNFSMVVRDHVGNDDNLYLTADFTMSLYDYIELQCLDDTKDAQVWIETGRSNN